METAVDDKERDYARKAERSLSLLFNLLPGNALVHDLCVSYSNKGDELILEIPELNLANNQFSTHINSTENGVRSEWICEGSLSDKERLVKARLYADEAYEDSSSFSGISLGGIGTFRHLGLRA